MLVSCSDYVTYLVIFFISYSEYLDNIRVVDRGVASVVEEVDKFFGGDNKTAFVFSSDHGMTNWG